MYQTPSANPEPSQRGLTAILAFAASIGNGRAVNPPDLSLIQERQPCTSRLAFGVQL